MEGHRLLSAWIAEYDRRLAAVASTALNVEWARRRRDSLERARDRLLELALAAIA